MSARALAARPLCGRRAPTDPVRTPRSSCGPRDLDKTAYHAATSKVDNTSGATVDGNEGEARRTPDITKLVAASSGHGSGKHTQRLFASALLRSDYHHLLNDVSIKYRTTRGGVCFRRPRRARSSFCTALR